MEPAFSFPNGIGNCLFTPEFLEYISANINHTKDVKNNDSGKHYNSTN